jgi:putative addiction module component (TIGR02574 family)
MGQAQKSFDDLTVEEQIQHVQDLWDRIASRPGQVPVTKAQRTELRRRLDEHRKSPSQTTPWDEVRDGLLKKP